MANRCSQLNNRCHARLNCGNNAETWSIRLYCRAKASSISCLQLLRSPLQGSIRYASLAHGWAFMFHCELGNDIFIRRSYCLSYNTIIYPVVKRSSKIPPRFLLRSPLQGSIRYASLAHGCANCVTIFIRRS